MSDPPRDPAKDADAARAELEQVRKDIERYQMERQAIEQEFERFTASFHDTPAAAPPPAPAPRPEPPSPPPQTLPQPVLEPADVAPLTFDPIVLDERSDLAQPPLPVPADPVKAVPPAPPARRRSSALPVLLVVLTIVLTAAGYVAWTSMQPAVVPEPAISTTPAVPTPAPPVAQEPAPAVTEAAPPPPQPSPSESVLTTTSAVWVRVVADGATVIARELPADARVPIAAQETIVIRTGNAGAVRLTIGGVDQGPLGRDGQVVTRRFDVPR
jgi:hypothetical protein